VDIHSCHVVQARSCAVQLGPGQPKGSALESWCLVVYIYILFVTTANLWPPRSLRIYIYIYIHVYILYIHIYQYQSGLCCSTSPACTLLGYVHGSSAVFCLASVGHAGVADRLHLEVVKQPAKYVTVLKAFPDPWGRQDFKNTHLLKRGRSPGPAQ
jgi:hypothetical protein